MLVYFSSNCYYNAINIYDLPDFTDFTMVKLTWGGTLGRRKITLEYYGFFFIFVSLLLKILTHKMTYCS